MRWSSLLPMNLMLIIPVLSACGGKDENLAHVENTSPIQTAAPTGENALKQVGQQRSGDYVVTLFNETGIVKQGPNRFTLEVRNALNNALTPVEKIHIESSMEMGEHTHMIGAGSAVPGDVPGRYIIGSNFAAKRAVGDDVSSPSAGRMRGQWKLVVTFHPDQRIEFDADVD